MSEPRIRCGDHVFHAPSEETWVVAWADYEANDLAWCGWPNGVARLSDCTLVKAATDEEHFATLEQVLSCSDSRALRAARLYGGANG
ncbi:MAG: hypothetical protein AB1698_22640 [Pseudomonadota bacterium]